MLYKSTASNKKSFHHYSTNTFPLLHNHYHRHNQNTVLIFISLPRHTLIINQKQNQKKKTALLLSHVHPFPDDLVRKYVHKHI